MARKNYFFFSYLFLHHLHFYEWLPPNRLLDMIMNDSDFSDSDDELEMLQAIALYEEEQNSEQNVTSNVTSKRY